MKKILIFGLIGLAFCGLFAQNLAEKQEELENLNSQITAQEQIIQDAESQKKESQKKLSTAKKNKVSTQKKINKIKKNETRAKETLDLTIYKIEHTRSSLEENQGMAEKEFRTLFSLHYQSKINSELQKDCYLMATVLKNTISQINRKERSKIDLEKEKNSTNKQYEDLIWERISIDKKREKYANKIRSISKDITKLDKTKSHAARQKTKLEKEASELDELIAKIRTEIVTENYSYIFSTERLIWPVKGEVIKGFGEQKNKAYKVSLYNNGIDISVAEGTPIVAVESGIVAFAEWFNGSGKLVIINHRNGFYSLYAHNSSLLVTKGDEVSKNQQISLSGKTGSVDIPCLHFELRKRGNSIDPLEYLENR